METEFSYVFKTRIWPRSETIERVDVDRGHEQMLKDEVKSQRSRTVEHPCKEQSRRQSCAPVPLNNKEE